jgi:SnoaL-like domain
MSVPILPPPVAAVVDAANRHDTPGFLSCFTDDGVVDDWGREFRGPDAIRAWSDAEFIGVEVRLDVDEVSLADETVTLRAEVGGHGYNGPSHFRFTVEGDRVARMEIRS